MSAGTLPVTPLADAVGARIDGVDLSGPLAPDAIEAVRAALFEHVVLVIRDQYLSVAHGPGEPRRMHRTTVGGERPVAAFGG